MKRGRQAKRRDRLSSSAYREAVLKRAAESLLGATVSSVEYPGGRSRESYRLGLADGRTLIATRRATLDLARREAAILAALGRHGVPAPALLGDNGAQILLQEELSGVRLSRALADADGRPARVEALLDSALGALAEAHAAGSAEGLERRVTTLGETEPWRRRLVERPAALGRHLELPAPAFDEPAVIERIAVRTPRFVKWDARPGNALVDERSRVHWFDWEHAGARNRLDDLAWALGDEFVPDDPDVEARLLERHLPRFADGLDEIDARDYLATYGTLHVAVRLGLILKHVDDAWWDLDRCIAEDRIGVTLGCALRLCARGARWAAAGRHTGPLSAWFEALVPRLRELVPTDGKSGEEGAGSGAASGHGA